MHPEKRARLSHTSNYDYFIDSPILSFSSFRALNILGCIFLNIDLSCRPRRWVGLTASETASKKVVAPTRCATAALPAAANDVRRNQLPVVGYWWGLSEESAY